MAKPTQAQIDSIAANLMTNGMNFSSFTLISYYKNATIENRMKVHSEFADNLLLILDAAAHFGLNVDELKTVGFNKFEICKLREWQEPDENGVVEHVRCITFDKQAQDSIPQHIKDKMLEDRKNVKCINCGSKMFSNFTGDWHDSEKCRGGKRAFNKSQEA
jgi:hypothetical protein